MTATTDVFRRRGRGEHNINQYDTRRIGHRERQAAAQYFVYEGEVARRGGDSTIMESYVHDARDEVEQSQIEHRMHELTQHGHLALVAAPQFALEEEMLARVREICPCYRTMTE